MPARARSHGPSRRSSRCGPARLTTAGGIAFYGTLEGYIKAVASRTARNCGSSRRPSGIIGNVFTYQYQRQAVRRRATRASAAGPASAWRRASQKSTEGLGAVGGYRELAKYTALGGTLFVFAIAGTRLIALTDPRRPETGAMAAARSPGRRPARRRNESRRCRRITPLPLGDRRMKGRSLLPLAIALSCDARLVCPDRSRGR